MTDVEAGGGGSAAQEDQEIDELFGGVEGEGGEREENEEGREDAGEQPADGEQGATAGAGSQEPVAEEPENVLKARMVEFAVKGPPAGSVLQYVSLSASLTIATHPFSPEQFAEPAPRGSTDNREYPWRVIRWREVRGMDGELHAESNARLVTWSDGSQHVMIGDRTLYEVTRQPMRRGTNALVSMCQTPGEGIVMTPFAPLSERLVFRLEKEPVELKRHVPDKKSRKVKIVAGKSAEDEARQLAEEDKLRSKTHLEKQRERKQRQSSSAAFDRQFLEEGHALREEDEYEKEFVNDEDEGAGGDSLRKRVRIDEESLTRSKRPAKVAAKEDDGLNLYDEDDDLGDFVVNDDEEEKGPIGSDSE